MGLGPGGQPINANRLGGGGGMGSMGPGGQSALTFFSYFFINVILWPHSLPVYIIMLHTEPRHHTSSSNL